MRIMIKGGVWKNTEDEILKAAVMKYGKNQWARISSLLVRKSAKQCKARWYEWLDPSIKKTEWTREEDEKLLHLAKLMPTQWRTIAPIVGRTPSQCLERYEKLLDAACAKDDNYEPNDDPRKLRPGEIDPNPESKPARPDPVDMDEDEKEMLSEARARLANTRGKKAKRKAREKQLEEARRLASLQKRRELKAAGIATRHRKRKRRGIDYNAEIPFEKRPPPGFFDVAGEERPVEQPKFPTTIEELEGKRRIDIEAQLRKQDAARNKIQQRQDAPAAILQANKLNDPEAVRKRSKLMLPAPQISNQELEEIAKMGYASDLALGSEEIAEGSGATRALIADYSQTPRRGMTPLRTPQRTPAGKTDAIMMEAENLARLRESQTPLLGGENPELHPSDFSGVTPRKRELQTPNPLATPLASPGPMGLTPRIGMTPSREGHSFGGTPKVTPFRDDLHINEDIEMQDSAKFELRRQEELRRNLRSGLTNLPHPKNEYQIVMQPIPEENEEIEEKFEEDMSDKIARDKAQEQARMEALMKKRSKVLQRELPRPPAASLELIKHLLVRGDEDKSSFVPPTPFEQADEMINKEFLLLLEHDNAKYPLHEIAEKDKVKGAKRAANGKPSNLVPEIEDFEEDELREADSMINEEMDFLRVAMGHENESFDDFVKARDACQEDLMFFPARSTYGLASVAGGNEKLAALQNEFEIVKNRMDDEAKKATRLEQKIKVLTHGYQTRGGKLWSQIEATFKQMGTAATELECFQALQKQEHFAASYRINNLIEEVNNQKQLEHNLQHLYGGLLTEEGRIHRMVEEHKMRLQIEEEIAARNRAAEEIRNRAAEEIAARNCAAEEEIAARDHASEEGIASENHIAEEGTAQNHTDGDEAGGSNPTSDAMIQSVEELPAVAPVLEADTEVAEEIAARDHASEEGIASENHIAEEGTAQNHTDGDEAGGSNPTSDAMNQSVEELPADAPVLEADTEVAEEIAARDHASEEGIASENHIAEEGTAQNHTDVDEAGGSNPIYDAMNQFVEEIPADVPVLEADTEVAEEIAARNHASEEGIASENHIAEEGTAQNHTDGDEAVGSNLTSDAMNQSVEEIPADVPVLEADTEVAEEIAARNHAREEGIASENHIAEESTAQNHTDGDEAGGSNPTFDAMNQSVEEIYADAPVLDADTKVPAENPALNEDSVENRQDQDLKTAEVAAELSIPDVKLAEDNQQQGCAMMVDNITSDSGFIQTDVPNPDQYAKCAPEDPTDPVPSGQVKQESPIGNADAAPVESAAYANTVAEANMNLPSSVAKPNGL